MENENDDESKAIQKALSDRTKIVGNDGAYLEVEAQDLISAYKRGDIQKAAVVVLKSARIEFSDPLVVKSISEKLKALIDDRSGSNTSDELQGLSDEQLSIYAAVKAFSVGFQK